MKTTYFSACLQHLALAVFLALPLGLVAQPGTTPAAAGPAGASALAYLRAHAAEFGLQADDLGDVVVTSSYTDAHNGVTHAYLRQRQDGRDIVGTEMGLHFTRAGALLTRTGTFVAGLRQQASRLAPPALGAAAATEAATRHLHLDGTRSAAAPAEAFVRRPDGTLRAIWRVQVRPATGPDAWTVLVDAATGQVLKASNRIIRERKPGFAPGRGLGGAVPGGGGGRAQGPAVANGYRVFAAPLESPLYGPATVVVSPADAVASPFGWHDTNGAAGAEFTIARGNNAHAYTLPATGTTTGFSPDGGATLDFDFAFTPTLSAQANQPAALTNVFYWTNLLHDISLRYGFSEASGNFQATNYSGQGLGSDYIRAQIGEAYSEAYFSPTADGPNASGDVPEIVLGIWQMPLYNALTLSGSPAVAGSYAVMPAEFGRQLSPTTPLTGALVLVNDGGPRPTQGCTSPLVNAAQVRSNIAVMDFPQFCSMGDQLLAAQAAGARAVIVINDLDFLYNLYYNPADTAGMRIPLVMVTRSDGRRIKAALRANTAVSASLLRTAAAPDRNGGFDNGIVAHEYAHGISTRLTGGPAGAPNCLDNAEQMGEGWSDFFELWMTTRPGDVGTTPRGVGAYALGQPTNGPGIRAMPYCTNFAVNNATYAFVGQTVDEVSYTDDPHATGSVWCAALWDLNWALIQRYGYDANLHTGTGGNNKTMQLVMDGLKLQPCSPGFLDGRDAILAADRATFGGANQALIWQVFARRGMGTNAVQGSSDNLYDNTAGFLVPGALATASAADPAAFDLYPNPATQEFTLRWAQPQGPALAIRVELLTVLGQPVRTQMVAAAEAVAGARIDLRGVAQGLYLVRASTSASTFTRRLVVQP